MMNTRLIIEIHDVGLRVEIPEDRYDINLFRVDGPYLVLSIGYVWMGSQKNAEFAYWVIYDCIRSAGSYAWINAYGGQYIYGD